MSEWPLEQLKALYLVALTLGLFIAISLWHKRHRNNFNASLSITLALLTLPLLKNYWLLSHGAKSIPLAFISLSDWVVLLYGPLLSLLMAKLINKTVSLRKICLPFLPFSVLLLIHLLRTPYQGNLMLCVVIYFIASYWLVNLYQAYQHRAALAVIMRGYTFSARFWLAGVVLGLLVLILLTLMTYIDFTWQYSSQEQSPDALTQFTPLFVVISGYLILVTALSLFWPEDQQKDWTGTSKITIKPAGKNSNHLAPNKHKPTITERLDLTCREAKLLQQPVITL